MELIRAVYGRVRPFEALGLKTLFTETSASFPSGHATFFFALATAVYLYNRRWGWWFFAAALLISLARVAAGVHYPSDIFGGALVGIVVATLVYRLTRER